MDCYIASLSLVLTAVITLCSAASIRYQDAPCHAEMLRKQKAYQESNLYMKYVPLPQCDEDGFYKSLQRKRSHFSCVTSHGFQVDYKEYYAKGPCERLKRCVRSNQIGGANDDDLVQCDEYGFFKQLQETKSWRVCTTVYGRILKWRNVSHESDCQSVAFVSAF